MSATINNDTLSGTSGSDTIDLLAGDDVYAGLAGNDSILGNEGNDSISGEDGADTILGGNGADSIFGGAGDDRIFPGAGNDSIDAGAGTGDSIRYNGPGALSEAITATINAPAGSSGYNAAIVTSLTQGNDTIAGFERLEGTNNSGDFFQVNGAATAQSALFIYGSTGNDTISVAVANNAVFADYNTASGLTHGVSVDLFTGTDSLGRATGSATDDFGTDILINVRGVSGTSLADTMLGTNFDDRFRGYAGSDSIDGRGGTDILDYASNAASQAISVNLGSGRANDGLGGIDTISNIEYVRATSGNDTLIGGETNDILRGNAGNDSIDGGNGSEDILDLSSATSAVSANLATGVASDGQGGTDSFTNMEVIYAGTGADTLIGGTGNDIFDGGMGGDLIDAGAGADRVRYYVVFGNNGAITRGVSVDLMAERATDGWGGADTLIGVERVSATSLNDTLIGDEVSNRFNGLGGNDSIDGGLGTDWLEFTNGAATSGATVNLTTGTASDGAGGIDSFTSMENVIGGNFADHLTGIAQFGRATSRLRGGSGNDTLIGFDGEFVIADYTDQTIGLSVNLASGSVNDGLGGIDSLVNIHGAIMYRNYADTIIGSAGNDWLAPSGGDDTIDGGEGFDILGYDGSSSGGVSVNLAAGTASDGDGGTDFFTSIEGVITGYSNDTVIGDDGNNLVTLGAGADYADAAGGQDTISASLNSSPYTQVYTTNEAGDQLPYDGVTIDLVAGRMVGGDGATDTILNFEAAIGSTMHDSILGSNAADLLFGAEGNDTIDAGAGNDTVLGSIGNDSLMGGAGDDLYLMAGNDGDATIQDTAGNDTVSLLGATAQEILPTDLDSAAGIDAIDLAGGGNKLHLTAAAVIALSETDTLRVFGTANDSVVFDDAGWVRGATSGGFITFTNGAATAIVGSGLVPAYGDSSLNGGTGNDVLGGDAGNDTIDGGDGNDTIAGYGGNDSILGGNDADMIDGGNGGDTIYGGAGNDLIQGGNGDDRIYGEVGNDTIDAGAGTTDRIVYNQTGGEAITATITSSGGASGINTAIVSTATQGTDSILGFEVLIGSNNGDLITVSSAATQNLNLYIYGSVGNDTIIDNYRQNGVFVDYSTTSTSLTSGVSVDLTSGIATDGFGGTDSLVGVTAVSGTYFADTLLGSAGNDRFRGGQGNDLIDGRGGTGDMVDYGANAASQAVSVNLATGSANDGQGGTDTLISIEQARGGAGNDILIGDNNNNTFRGNGGNDTIDGAGGTSDVADYAFASAAVSVNLATGQAQDGQGGTDSLTGIEFVFGSAFGDTLIGGDANDNLRGNAGNDMLDGGAGTADVAQYASATTGITVNMGTGTVQDGLGGTDSLTGIEQIWGSSYNDSMLGSTGADYFVGSTGADTMVGGAGNDAANYAFYPSTSLTASQGVSINLATGMARDGFGYTDSLSGIEIIHASSLVDTITGGDANETIYGNGGADSLGGGNGHDQIYGFSGNETISGGDGDDTLYGDAGNNRLLGGAGNDRLYTIGASNLVGEDGDDALYGGNAADTMEGGNGADTLYGNGGADSLSGGDGDDQLYGNSANETLSGGNGSDQIAGGDAADLLMGDSGADSIYAGNGDDNITGGDGNDLLSGESGNDTIATGIGTDNAFGGDGNDLIIVSGDGSFDGQTGTDTLQFATTGRNITDAALASSNGIEVIDLAGGGNTLNLSAARVITLSDTDTLQVFGSGTDSVSFSDTGWVRGTASAGFITFTNGGATVIVAAGLVPEPSGPGAGNDTLTGTMGADSIAALGGNDSVLGLNGADTLDGGLGDDTLDGGLGNDLLIGGAGNDIYIVDSANDVVQDAAGTDTILLRANSFSLVGVSVEIVTGDNPDMAFAITGNTLATRLTGGGLNDTIRAYQGADTVYGLNGNDYLDGGSENDLIDGGNGADTIIGNTGDDTISGGAGNNSLSGGAGNDSITGGADLDWVSYADLTASSQAVTLDLTSGRANGASGDDMLSGIENIITGAGNDSLMGNSLGNTLSAGLGNDTLSGGGGDDVIDGGGNIDWLSYAELSTASQAVTVNLTSGRATGAAGADTLSSIENIITGAGNDSLLGDSLGNALSADLGADTLDGGLGDDTLDGGLGNDRLIGGAGNDVYIVDSTNDVVQDTAGTDTILLRANSFSLVGVSVEIVTGDNPDMAFAITGNTLATRLTGGGLNDTIRAYQGADTVYGLNGNDYLDGGSENDLIDGGNGADTIIGNTGADTISGGAGNDLLNGGTGTDQFVFNTALGGGNIDTLQGYNVVDDVILLDDAIFTALGAPGALAAGAFNTGTAATQSDDRIIFNVSSGALLYDADGVGGAAAIQFATLTGITGTITHAEFLII